MKRCSYCGCENADDAVYCRGCGTTEFAVIPPPSNQKSAETKSKPPEALPLLAPLPPGEVAISWRARDAWLCLLCYLGLLLSFVVVLFALLKASNAFDDRLSGTSWLVLIIEVVQTAVLFGCSLFFSRVQSFIDFKLSFRLMAPHEKEIALALLLGAVMAFLQMQTLYGGAVLLENVNYFNWFTIAALTAPFFEEVFFRGFLYRSFRNSYHCSLSTVLVVSVSCLFHLDRLRYSPLALVGIGLANIVFCVLKERTDNLWTCIACHFAFNTVILLLGGA